MSGMVGDSGEGWAQRDAPRSTMDVGAASENSKN